MFKFQLNVPVFFYILGKFLAVDKDNLKAKNHAIFVLEREFLDLRKKYLVQFENNSLSHFITN